MNMKKLRLYVPGLLAFLIGIPLTEQAFGQAGSIISASFDLAGAIASSAGRS